MRLVSTTLTGNSADLIGDALRSVVDWVDACLVIDTGVTDESLAIARDVAKEKYVERKLEWRNDFAAARNFALGAAHEAGGDWALMLDTDERIELGGTDVRAELAREDASVLMVSDAARIYVKERFFRLPVAERYVGPIHEAFPSYKVGRRTLEGVAFHETPKSAESLKKKLTRDLGILGPYVRAHPDDPRWHYYLGETLKNLGRLQEAIAAYDACAALRGWNEESAWACYRSAECLCELGRYREAIERCAAGLARHAGVAELAWLAGFAAFRLGDSEQAACWARLAITHGMFRGAADKVSRIGFRYRPALYEGPYDILRYALSALGDKPGAAEAEQLYLAAREMRERG